MAIKDSEKYYNRINSVNPAGNIYNAPMIKALNSSGHCTCWLTGKR
jgi:hypothetical protein